MKIIALEHEVLKNNNPKEYFKKIEQAVNQKPDIVVGPDYGLSFLNQREKIKFGMRNYIIQTLDKISNNSPETLIVPGTTPLKLSDEYMGHSAMIFKNGKKIDEFRKETDVGDHKVAKKNNLIYKGGDSYRNHLEHMGKEITIEICSDHGKQRFEKDPFLEIILAYDDRAGFFPTRAGYDNFTRWGVISDGRSGKASCFNYNPDLEKKIGMIKGEKAGKGLVGFELDESKLKYF